MKTFREVNRAALQLVERGKKVQVKPELFLSPKIEKSKRFGKASIDYARGGTPAGLQCNVRKL